MLEGKLGAHSFHFLGGGLDVALAGPIVVDGEDVDVGVGDVDADDFDHDALAEDVFEVAGEFFDGGHEGLVIFVTEVVDTVDFGFGDDEGVAGGLGLDIEEGEGAVVFVDFVTGEFALDDFGENTAHRVIISYGIVYNYR